MRQEDIDSNLKTIPMNVNLFKHIISNKQANSYDIYWTLSLREENKNNEKWKEKMKTTKDLTIEPPKFYDDDFNFYKKKKDKKEHVSQFYKTENTFKLAHFIHSPNHINQSQLDFGSSMREVNQKNLPNTPSRNTQWKNLAYSPQYDKVGHILEPLTEKGKINLNKMVNNTWRDYKTTFSKEDYNGKKILRKKIGINKNNTLPFLGEHFSLPAYTNKPVYGKANVNSYTHVLKTHSNPVSSFEIGLRYHKNDEKLIKPCIPYISKEEKEKIQEFKKRKANIRDPYRDNFKYFKGQEQS